MTMTTPAGEAHDFATDPDTYARWLRNRTSGNAFSDLMSARTGLPRGARLPAADVRSIVDTMLASVRTQERITRPRARPGHLVGLDPAMTGLHGDPAPSHRHQAGYDGKWEPQ